MSKTFIIAEAGVNHNGDMSIAKRLIEEAKECGADAVKFQSFTSEGLLSEDVKLEHVEGGSLKKFFDSVALSKQDHALLMDHCDKVGIEFMSTPFSFEAADMLDELGVKRFKIASCDINNIPFLEYVAKKGKPMIVSTGTASADEIEEAYNVISEHIRPINLTFLHCVANYPTKLENANLLRMKEIEMHEMIDCLIGFSDHTQGIAASTAAVALGANVIERHFTLDRAMNGPDHNLSSDPIEFKRLVNMIRDVEKCLIHDNGEVAKSEKEITPLIRRSIVAARDIGVGEVISAEEITYKRPGTGLPPGMYVEVIGKQANREIKENEQIKMEDLK